MQTSINDSGAVSNVNRNSATLLFLILLLTAAIAICPRTLAQKTASSILQDGARTSCPPACVARSAWVNPLQRKFALRAQADSDVRAPTGEIKNAETLAPRRVLVRSTALLVRAAVVEDKLLKRPEFKQLGFSITRDEADADLILELRHDLFTKYVFSVVEVKTRTVLVSGKVSSLGGTVAGKVAKRFVKDMSRMPAP